ncbi:MAG: oxygen-independent coproporphyrinogen III oxidase [Proteobacteria bacterium]|nr:MAG: oxygen-independent coproporphyrinogen III oxidase [Pseudomonadota bacterium]
MIDFDKFVKYAKPGPRYTSYPTAPEFHGEFSHEEYTHILKNQDKNRPLSLYFHLPFCRSACYFCGCNVVFTSKNDKKERYIQYLKKEVDILSKHLDTSRDVLQLHFGGGTPTFFDANQLESIIRLIKDYFPNFARDAEVSCEIDPRFLTKEQLDVLIAGGFNRISYGVQDFNEEIQKIIHRIQPYEITKNAVDMARAVGIKSINMDLIYGFPHQSLESFKKTLDIALTLSPDRFAVFNYAHIPWLKKTMRKFDETTLPSPQEKLNILKYTINFFQENGYKMIGMDHFAKPEDELFLAIEKGELHRNFQGYTTKGGADLIGIGLTSIGEGEGHYAQNFKDMKEYEEAIDEGRLPLFKGIVLNEDDKLRKAVIMELMSNFKLNISSIEENFKIDFFKYFADAIEELKEFEAQDLLSISKEAILVHDTGELLIRNISMPFDAYLKGNKQRRFSKTI